MSGLSPPPKATGLGFLLYFAAQSQPPLSVCLWLTSTKCYWRLNGRTVGDRHSEVKEEAVGRGT